MRMGTRREFLRDSVGVVAGLAASRAWGALPSDREVPRGKKVVGVEGVEVLFPRGRVPVSFIIDDSTCLVNMGHYCMPQFRAAWPTNPQYQKRWKDWPREIPDSFVREFGEFCASAGVRGKWSVVPYPACVGWLDRELPGWSRAELRDSLKLVREVMVPNWDITPEMITHTRVIDVKTGRPLEEVSAATMENSYPPERRSADELAGYMAYALRILRNCELGCGGITTPGGFGNKCKSELSLAVGQAVRDVFPGVEVPHYFKYIAEGEESTEPRLEHVEGAEGDSPRVVVNVPAGTGDWFGGWDGAIPPQGEKYVDGEGTSGRMVELIEGGRPAVMFGHWAGFYSNGSKAGFAACKKVISTLNGKYGDRLVWMTTGEMARYWAGKELTRVERDPSGTGVVLDAPFGCPSFTVGVKRWGGGAPVVMQEGRKVELKEVREVRGLVAGTWVRKGDGVVVCFDLARGRVGVVV